MEKGPQRHGGDTDAQLRNLPQELIRDPHNDAVPAPLPRPYEHDPPLAEGGEPVARQRTNKEVLAAAKIGIELAAEHVRGQETQPGVRPLAEHLIKHEGAPIPLQLMTPEMAPGHPLRGETMSSVADSAIFRL